MNPRRHERVVDFLQRGSYLYVEGRRGTQVVRERSAKPLCVGSIPTRASNPPNLIEFVAAVETKIEVIQILHSQNQTS